MNKSLVYLEKQNPKGLVDAQLCDEITDEHISLWRSTWLPLAVELEAKLTRDKIPLEKWPQDIRWKWDVKANWFKKFLAFKCFSLMCEDKLQGLLILDLSKQARIKEQIGQHLVYIHFVATAPWNRKDFGVKPLFRLVGSTFIRTAIEVSKEESFHGRIGLHSLLQSEDFYSVECEMTKIGHDPHKENLMYFEMTAEQAESFCKKQR